MSDQEEVDIVLADLPDDELVEQMFDDLYDGLADEVAEGTEDSPEPGLGSQASARRSAGRRHDYRRHRLP